MSHFIKMIKDVLNNVENDETYIERSNVPSSSTLFNKQRKFTENFTHIIFFKRISNTNLLIKFEMS